MDQTLPATPTAPMEAGMLPGSVAVQPGQELSVVSLFLHADTIVKIVMLLLLLASFWTWAIIFDKALRLYDKATKLDPANFVRIHRSRIIRGDFIRELRLIDNREYIVKLSDGSEHRSSRTYADALESWLS